MQKKLNEDFIEKYSEQFAAKISEDFYASNSHIGGSQILNITPSKQVNFFIIKLLFNNWQQESQRLESPFFNYGAMEVKEALLQFMNVLSRFIKVERKEFEPLLQDAIRDTLFLIMAPNVYLEIEFDRKGTETLDDKMAKTILKYIRIAKPDFINYFETNIGLDKDDLEIDEGVITNELLEEEIAKLNQVIPLTLKKLEEGDDEDATENLLRIEADDLTPTIARSSDSKEKVSKAVDSQPEEVETNEDSTEDQEPEVIEPIPTADEEVAEEAEQVAEIEDEVKDDAEISEDDSKEEAKKEEAKEEATEEEAKEEEIKEEAKEEEIKEEEKEEEIKEEEKAKEEVKEVDSPEEIPETEGELTSNSSEEIVTEDVAEQVEEETEDTLDESDESQEDADESKEDLAEITSTDESVITNMDPEDEDDEDDDILNDKFEDPLSVPTIAESHEGQADSMMAAISVNHRYMFINELFDGEAELFTTAITRVEESASFDESVEILVQNYAREYHWDMNSDEVKELLKIIFRRFR